MIKNRSRRFRNTLIKWLSLTTMSSWLGYPIIKCRGYTFSDKVSVSHKKRVQDFSNTFLILVMNLFNESATLKQKYDKANNSRFKNETILKPRLHVNKIVYKWP